MDAATFAVVRPARRRERAARLRVDRLAFALHYNLGRHQDSGSRLGFGGYFTGLRSGYRAPESAIRAFVGPRED